MRVVGESRVVTEVVSELRVISPKVRLGDR